ncbi:transcription factor bHLH122-like [Impatiens glandulifera]|uniref:transcription factor bHLH122-like n=1 Tax=Impatiens glandulifera TaxID=253017 RepID=UPI001FB13A1C|nr:transcription factor bHLH122-like [Impatiens glandulifera]
MDSQHQQQQQQQMNSGLTRYRSAPSSYYASFLNSGEDRFDQFLKDQTYKQEPQENFMRYASDGTTIEESSLRNQGLRSQSMNPQAKQDDAAYSFTSSHQSHHQNTVVASSDMNQMDPEISRGISLVRQSSSPAGFLSYFNAENDFCHEMGGGNSSESTFSSSRLRVQMDFTSRHQPSSSTRMAPIPETPNSSNIGIGTNNNTTPEADRNCGGGYIPNFPIESWDDSMNLSGSYLGFEDDDIKPETGSISMENQLIEDEKRPPALLSRHMSLPQTTMEKLLQDSIPFKTRAKRGCATHPRSVAERVRRTKISERIRKLQELVPNMDKQTNTADMLDLAVDYIKDLQRDVKILTEGQANCKCPHKSDR